MKKKLNSLLAIALILAIAASGFGVSAEVFLPLKETFVETNAVCAPKKSVTTDGTTLTLTFNFDSLAVKESILEGKRYIQIPGFGLNETQGEAALPVRTELLSTGKRGVEYQVVSVTYDYTDIPFNYSPALPLQGNSDTIFSPSEIVPITLVNDFEPAACVTDLTAGIYRGIPINRLAIRPVQYNSAKKIARINHSITIKLQEKSAKVKRVPGVVIPSYPDINWDDVMIRHTCYGSIYAKLDSVYSEQVDRHLLILTTPSLLSEANRLKLWKQECGFACSVVTKSNWTSTGIKESITDCMAQNPELYYVILLGDHNMLPSYPSRLANKYVGHSKAGEYLSDFPYACLDGDNDFIQDLYIGRIPASSISECRNAIDKILSYEQMSAIERIPTRAHFCTYFEDIFTGYKNYTPGDGVEDRGYTYFTEEIFQQAKSKFDAVNRIYYCKPEVSPNGWSENYTWGFKFPDALKRPNFSWNGNKSDITYAFNKGCDLFYHRDHGDIDGWSFPEFNTSDLNGLTNTQYPIVISIDCLVGKYDEANCFAKNMLLYKNGGCATIIAASQPSNSIRNDALGLGLFTAIWPDADLEHTHSAEYGEYRWPEYEQKLAYSIGEMLGEGLLKVENTCWKVKLDKSDSDIYQYDIDYVTYYNRELYHILGDPTLGLHWDSSDACNAVARIEKSDSLLIEFYKGDATFGVYDEVTGESHRFYGNSLSYACADPSKVKVKIFKPGMRTIYADHIETATQANIPSLILSNAITEGDVVKVTVQGNEEAQGNNPAKITVGTLSGSQVSADYIPGTNSYEFNLGPVVNSNIILVVLEEEGCESQSIKIAK